MTKINDYKKIPERLKEIQRRLNIKNDSDFAKKCGISAPFLSQIYSGERLGGRSLDRIATKLGVTPAYLKGEEVTIPVVSEVSAGEPFQCPDGQLIDIIDISELPLINIRMGDSYYAVRVRGSSMFPVLKDGDTMIAEKESFYKVKGGDKVVFRDNEGYCWVKYVEFTDSSVILRSLNPAYPSVSVSKNNISIMDKIVYIIPH